MASGEKRRTMLAEGVAARIRTTTAQLGPGTRLPSVRELMAKFGVSQHAIQKALEQLRAEGLIISHVGKGTFVGDVASLIQTAEAKSRSVLTLTRERAYSRGDAIARRIHQRLLIDGHNSLVIAYNDEQHLMEQLKGDVRFDACILQPRASIVSTSLLDFTRQRAERVIVEAFNAEGLNVDAVSNDPLTTVRLVMGAFSRAGHRNILWLTENRQNYFFHLTSDLFRAYCAGMGLAEGAVPIAVMDVDENSLNRTNNFKATLAEALKRHPGTTAIVVASFIEGPDIVGALDELGLSVPRDLSIIRMGSPDLETDHVNRLDVVGRPSARAAETVVNLLYHLWQRPAIPPSTLIDTPEIVSYGSVQPPHRK